MLADCISITPLLGACIPRGCARSRCQRRTWGAGAGARCGARDGGEQGGPCLSAGMPPRGVSHGTTTVSVRALDRLHALLEQEVVKEMSESRRDGAGFLIHGAVRWGQLECVPKATVSTGQEVEERPGLEGPTYSSSTSSGLHCRGLICCLVTVLLNHMYRNEMSDWYIHGAIHCYNRA
jgi:hypothetical protein